MIGFEDYLEDFPGFLELETRLPIEI